jgi:hypothetical protein
MLIDRHIIVKAGPRGAERLGALLLAIRRIPALQHNARIMFMILSSVRKMWKQDREE